MKVAEVVPAVRERTCRREAWIQATSLLPRSSRSRSSRARETFPAWAYLQRLLLGLVVSSHRISCLFIPFSGAVGSNWKTTCGSFRCSLDAIPRLWHTWHNNCHHLSSDFRTYHDHQLHCSFWHKASHQNDQLARCHGFLPRHLCSSSLGAVGVHADWMILDVQDLRALPIGSAL